MFSNLFIGDNGQLHPFTVTARKMQLMPSIFDLAISRPMKQFTIHNTDPMIHTKRFKVAFISISTLYRLVNNIHYNTIVNLNIFYVLL